MAKENKKLDWVLIVAIVLVLFSIFLFVLALNLKSFIVLETKEIPIAVTITDYAGLNVSQNQSVLHLGSVKKNTFASRNLNIKNEYPFPTIFMFDVTGNIENLIKYDKYVYFKPLESKFLPFKTKLIENEEIGEYSGVIFIEIKRVPQ